MVQEAVRNLNEPPWSEPGEWGEPGLPRFALFQNRTTRDFKVFKIEPSWLVGIAAPLWTILHSFKKAAALTWIALGVALVGSFMGEYGLISIYLLACFWAKEQGPRWTVERGLSEWAECDVLDLGVNTAKNAEMAVRAAQASADRHWRFFESLVKQPPEAIEQALALLNEQH